MLRLELTIVIQWNLGGNFWDFLYSMARAPEKIGVVSRNMTEDADIVCRNSNTSERGPWRVLWGSLFRKEISDVIKKLRAYEAWAVFS